MSKLREFQDAVLVRNVLARAVDPDTALVSRVASRSVEGKQFPTQKALESYLKDHPKADKSKHHVKGDESPKEYAERKKQQESGKPKEFKDETPEEHKKRVNKIEKTKKDDAEAKRKKENASFKDETEEEYATRKKHLENGTRPEPKDETEAEYKARLQKLKDREKK